VICQSRQISVSRQYLPTYFTGHKFKASVPNGGFARTQGQGEKAAATLLTGFAGYADTIGLDFHTRAGQHRNLRLPRSDVTHQGGQALSTRRHRSSCGA